MSFEVRTEILFGVFVTQKSFYIGRRKLLKRYHAEMLVSRICGNRFPKEIREPIEDYLHELEKVEIDAAWLPDRGYSGNRARFQFGDEAVNSMEGLRIMPAEVAVRERLVADAQKARTGVEKHVGFVEVTKSQGWNFDYESGQLVHLRTSRLPQMHYSVPQDPPHVRSSGDLHPVASSPESTCFDGTQGIVRSLLQPASLRCGDNIVFNPSFEKGRIPRACDSVKRLMEIDLNKFQKAAEE